MLQHISASRSSQKFILALFSLANITSVPSDVFSHTIVLVMEILLAVLTTSSPWTSCPYNVLSTPHRYWNTDTSRRFPARERYIRPTQSYPDDCSCTCCPPHLSARQGTDPEIWYRFCTYGRKGTKSWSILLLYKACVEVGGLLLWFFGGTKVFGNQWFNVSLFSIFKE